MQKIKFQRSKTKGAIPTAEQVAEGEIAINLTDKKIFTNNGEEIVSIGGSASGASEYTVETGAVTAEPNKGYLLSTESESATVALPAEAEISNGTSVSVGDWDGFAWKNNITVTPNDGQTVMGHSEPFVLDVGYVVVTFVYIESVKDWRIVNGAGESAQISDGVPVGTIVLFAKQVRPGYLPLDGTNYPDMATEYPQFFEYWQDTQLPDWRDRVVKMAGEDLEALEQKGWCIPSHTHSRGTQNIRGSIAPCVNDPDSAWIPVNGGSGALVPAHVNKSTHQISYGSQAQGLNYGIYFDAARNWSGTSSVPEGLDNGQVGDSNEVDRVGAIYAIKVAGRVSDEGLAEMDAIKAELATKYSPSNKQKMLPIYDHYSKFEYPEMGENYERAVFGMQKHAEQMIGGGSIAYADTFIMSGYGDHTAGAMFTSIGVTKHTNNDIVRHIPQVVFSSSTNKEDGAETLVNMGVCIAAYKNALYDHNLNDMVYTGVFAQKTSAVSTPENNYPVHEAGMLEVVRFSNDWVYQRYTSYNGHDIYIRRRYGNTWSSWYMFTSARQRADQESLEQRIEKLEHEMAALKGAKL